MDVRYHSEAKITTVAFLVGTDPDDAIRRAQRGSFFHSAAEAVMECEFLYDVEELMIFESTFDVVVISPKLVEF